MGEAEAQATLTRWGEAFPTGYRERFSAAAAVLEIDRALEARARGLALHLFRPVETAAREVRLKVYHPAAAMPLSDVIPVMENFGFRVLNEIPLAQARQPAIDELPLPRPLVEIFVYSPRVEGVHLRGGKVARGGIRWSDRREDFRTEILGLMKAQR
jgi:NAD-specific glutamate dehydrogenase